MKRLFSLSFILPALIAVAFVTAMPPGLVGRWIFYGKGDDSVFLDFKKDNTYAVSTATGQQVITGKYYVSADTFALTDETCGSSYPGRYKLSFYGEDSVSLALIADSCVRRAQDLTGLTGKRISKTPE